VEPLNWTQARLRDAIRIAIPAFVALLKDDPPIQAAAIDVLDEFGVYGERQQHTTCSKLTRAWS
jgi:hypothetical protein